MDGTYVNSELEVFNTFMVMDNYTDRIGYLVRTICTGWKCDMKIRHRVVGDYFSRMPFITVNIRLSFNRPKIMPENYQHRSKVILFAVSHIYLL